MNVGFIGGGRIARIMCAAFERGGMDTSMIVVSEPGEAAVDLLRSRFPKIAVSPAGETGARSDILFLALHPPAIAEGLKGVAETIQEKTIVVSLAPKVSLKALSGMLGGHRRIARMIPNAPSIVGKGFNPISYHEALDRRDRAVLEGIFKTLGACPEVDEAKLEAYAVLTAMGPTYFLFQVQEIMSLSRDFGLEEGEIIAASKAMLEGMTAMIFESGLPMDAVMDLIPGKPMSANEEAIREMYRDSLRAIHSKLKA